MHHRSPLSVVFRKALLCAAFALFLPVLVPVTTSDAQETASSEAKIKEQELEEVRRRISELKESMDQRAEERSVVTAELESAELLIAAKRLKLNDIEREREVSEIRKAELESQIASKEKELVGEREQLADQARAAYMSGGQERIRLLLNQRDPATLGRQLKYYEYLANYRADNIESVSAHLATLAELHGSVERETRRLAELADAETREMQALNTAQGRRQELLASLDARLSSEGAEVERLAAEERDLARLIAELSSILSDYPITSEDPFAELKGRLTWPVAGKVTRNYGDNRASGQLKWKGVVVSAPRGREVRSVYHGRVVFADWLAGMGLLAIVDHGEGYMTLYGYNETLLKSPGDWVAPGDVIATVGDSGGQAEAGLYFEVRQGTQPVDPSAWVSRQPKDR